LRKKVVLQSLVDFHDDSRHPPLCHAHYRMPPCKLSLSLCKNTIMTGELRQPIHINLPEKTGRAPLPIILPKNGLKDICPSPELTEPYSLNGDRIVEIAAQIGEIRQLVESQVAKGGVIIETPAPPDQQQLRFGRMREQHGLNTTRGYLIIEPENMLEAMRVLFLVGKQRADAGNQLEFKWWQPYEGIQGRGSHAYHFYTCGYLQTPQDQLITLYADTTHDIQNTFEMLIATNQWSHIELTRKTIARQWITPNNPIKGEYQFTSNNGQKWSTLEYNVHSGTQSQAIRQLIPHK
jgi:hypothetical protein